MFEDFDRTVGVFAESLARKLGRRKMVDTTVKGLFATVTAATLGQLIDVGDAFAQTCDCGAHPASCQSQGRTCPAKPGCPTNCVICVKSDCNGDCSSWTTGQWVSCTGLGTCHKGYKVCTDCKCGGCLYVQKCSCLSQCICCSCCTARDVRVEMQRLAAAGV